MSKFKQSCQNLFNTDTKTPYLVRNIIFVVSAIFTIMLLASMGSTLFSKGLFGLLGCAEEIAKFTLAIIAVVGVIWGVKFHWGLRIFAGLLALACFYYSIMASEGYQLIELQAINNKAITESVGYKELQGNKARIKGQIEYNKIQINNILALSKDALKSDATTNKDNKELTNTYNNEIKSLQNKLEEEKKELKKATSKGWHGRKSNAKKAIEDIKTQIKSTETARDSLSQGNSFASSNKLIDNLSNKNSKLNDDLLKLGNGNKNGSNDSFGYEILFKNTDVESLQGRLNTFLNRFSILIELIGIYFSIICAMKDRKSTGDYDGGGKIKKRSFSDLKLKARSLTKNSEPLPSPTAEFEQENTIAKNSNVIEFKPKLVENKSYDILQPVSTHTIFKTDCADKETVKKYLEVAEKSKESKKNKDEISGIVALGKEIGLKESEAREIFDYLKKAGIVETKNRASYLVKTKDEYKKALGL